MTTSVREQVTASIRFSSKSVYICKGLLLSFMIDIVVWRERWFSDIQSQEHEEGLAKSSDKAQEYNSLREIIFDHFISYTTATFHSPQL